MINKSFFNNPSKLKKLTGLTKTQFDSLCSEVAPLWNQSEERRLSRPDRKRQIGAGRNYQLATIEEKVLCLLVWLKLYPSYWFLGFMFGLDGSNALRLVRRIKPLVTRAADKQLNRRLIGVEKKVGRKKISSWEDLETEFPEIAEILIDAMEQPIRRPKQVNGRKAGKKQRKHYSGKKKRHTRKTQLTINRQGTIMHLSESFPGSVHDYKLLKKSKVMDKIPKTSKKLVDKGYDGIKQEYPEHHAIDQPIKRRRNSPPLTRQQKRYNKAVSSARILIEHVIARVKKYEVMRDTYRNRLRQYDEDVKVVAALVNYRLLSS